MYFLLGHRGSTCLVVVARSEMTMDQYVTERFDVIRKTYDLPHTWPSPDQVKLITSISDKAASRAPPNESSPISSIMAFIGGVEHGDPISRLTQLLNAMDLGEWRGLAEEVDSGKGQDKELTCTRAPPNLLSAHRVPPEIDHTVNRILIFHQSLRSIYYPGLDCEDISLSLQMLSWFLDIEPGVIDRALNFLTPFVFRYPSIGAWNLHEYPSFIMRHSKMDFFEFALPDTWLTETVSDEAWLETSAQCIRFCNTFPRGNPQLLLGASGEDNVETLTHQLTLGLYGYEGESGSERALEWDKMCLLEMGWFTLGYVADKTGTKLLEQVRDLRFSSLNYRSMFRGPFGFGESTATRIFVSFVNKLYRLVCFFRIDISTQ
jgi:hypothetical protein